MWLQLPSKRRTGREEKGIEIIAAGIFELQRNPQRVLQTTPAQACILDLQQAGEFGGMIGLAVIEAFDRNDLAVCFEKMFDKMFEKIMNFGTTSVCAMKWPSASTVL